MTDLDGSSWRPDWRPADEQVAAHVDALRALVGRRITDAWIVWDLEHDEWFADLPVVIEFDEAQRLELCWQKFDDLSLTWNTINVAVAPTGWVSWPLEWRSQAHPALRSVVNRTVRELAVTQHLLKVHSPEPGGDSMDTWLTGGVWLQTDDGGVEIFNALDENGLTAEPPTVSPTRRRALSARQGGPR